MKFATDAAWKSVGILVPMLFGMMVIGVVRRARPGRPAARGEEAEARLRPPQRDEGHQAIVRRPVWWELAKSIAKIAVLLAIAWPAVAHAITSLSTDLERIARLAGLDQRDDRAHDVAQRRDRRSRHRWHRLHRAAPSAHEGPQDVAARGAGGDEATRGKPRGEARDPRPADGDQPQPHDRAREQRRRRDREPDALRGRAQVRSRRGARPK